MTMCGLPCHLACLPASQSSVRINSFCLQQEIFYTIYKPHNTGPSPPSFLVFFFPIPFILFRSYSSSALTRHCKPVESLLRMCEKRSNHSQHPEMVSNIVVRNSGMSSLLLPSFVPISFIHCHLLASRSDALLGEGDNCNFHSQNQA